VKSRTLVAALLAFAGFSVATPKHASAQAAAAQLLARAETLYNNSSIEAARQLFVQVTNYKGAVTTAQRVDAYKYLGASYAVLGVKDSAASYFVAALDIDPFTTLESTFGGDEQAAFSSARKTIFKAAIDTISQKAIDPQSSKTDSSIYTFRIVTTHSAKVTVDLLLRSDSSKQQILYSGNNDGARDIPWNGLILAQRADSGIYELRVTAIDPATPLTPDKPSVLFRVSHVYEPLETPLPPITAADTLVSQNGKMAPVWDFLKGMSIATVAATLPAVALNKGTLPDKTTHMAVGVGLGVIAGSAAALFGSSHPNNPTAVAENERRKRQHDAFNAAVDRRNRARLARTILVIRPLTGTGG
jgi:hypothetical protein